MSIWLIVLCYHTDNRAIWSYIFTTKAKQIVDIRQLNKNYIKKDKNKSR
jgi:hypothetical protein